MAIGISVEQRLKAEWEKISTSIRHQMVSRAYRGANELRNASQLVLRGQRHGKRYIVPGTGRLTYKKGKRIVVGREADNYGRKGRKIYRREAGTAKITYKYYTASAPGEPPAVRTGAFRLSWKPEVYVDHTEAGVYKVINRIYSNQRTDNGKYLLGEILENGTGKMAPRPHHNKIKQKARPAIKKIYSEPYV